MLSCWQRNMTMARRAVLLWGSSTDVLDRVVWSAKNGKINTLILFQMFLPVFCFVSPFHLAGFPSPKARSPRGQGFGRLSIPTRPGGAKALAGRCAQGEDVGDVAPNTVPLMFFLCAKRMVVSV